MNMTCPVFLVLVFISGFAWGFDSAFEENVTDFRESLRNNLLQQMNGDFGWDHGETPLAVVTLSLSNYTLSNQNNLRNALIEKQLKLELAAILLRWHKEDITAGKLALFVNALIAVCGDPWNFYNVNLISRLRHMQIISDYERALVSLTLCNANADISREQINMLNSFLISGNVSHPIDTQAMALIALTCIKEHFQSTYVRAILNDSLSFLTSKQRSDGSFGNIYTTGIVLQALISAGDIGNTWQFENALYYIKSEYDKPSIMSSVLSTFFILPAMQLQSLSDLWKVENCKKDGYLMPDHENDIWSVIASEEETSKMNISLVTYTLWYPDTKNESQTIRISTDIVIQQGLSLLDVMAKAVTVDDMYKYSLKTSSHGILIHSLAGLKNNDMNKYYWFLYQFPAQDDKPIMLEKDVSSIKPSDGDHFLLWYRKI